jgi:hypothetical protein
VDDFAIVSRSQDTAEKLIQVINSHAMMDSQGIGVRTVQGISSHYNGIDVHQTQDYIKLSCETYIKWVLQTHDWETPSPRESDQHDLVPMSSDNAAKLLTMKGPMEGSTEHRKLEEEMRYSYHQVLGELIYAYVICHLDIGFAITLLAHFAQSPAKEHYLALKHVVRYLRQTMNWGIMYWRKQPLLSLPKVPYEAPEVDQSLPQFPVHDPLQLVGFVDAAHAVDIETHRSITGLVFSLAGGAISYKSKLQATVATSSMESEFIAAVHAAKIAKYLCSVLEELGFVQKRATPLYEDNQAAIAMINENKPTTRSRHIDIQHFAIQEWRAWGIVEMYYIPGVVNPADQATKALGWTLHSRHARRGYGSLCSIVEPNLKSAQAWTRGGCCCAVHG